MFNDRPLTKRQWDVLNAVSEDHDIEADLDGKFSQNDEPISIVLIENLINAGYFIKPIGMIVRLTKHDLTEEGCAAAKSTRPAHNPHRAKRNPATQVYLGDKGRTAGRLKYLSRLAERLGYANHHQLIAAIADGEVNITKSRKK